MSNPDPFPPIDPMPGPTPDPELPDPELPDPGPPMPSPEPVFPDPAPLL